MKSSNIDLAIVCITIIVVAAIIACVILGAQALRNDGAEITVMDKYTRTINVYPDITCGITAVDPHVYVVMCSQ